MAQVDQCRHVGWNRLFTLFYSLCRLEQPRVGVVVLSSHDNALWMDNCRDPGQPEPIICHANVGQ